MYDANLFATPASRAPHADFVTRFAPAFEVGYLTVPIELEARYEMQAERYFDHPNLNDSLAGHDAAATMRFLPNERFNLSLGAQFVRTQTPGELNIQSQLMVGRAPAERRAVTSTAAFNWSHLTSIAAAHRFGRDELLGTFASTTNTSQLGIRHRTSDRSVYRADYELRHVDFDGGSPIVSHVITAGRSYAITPRTAVEIAAGPRFTEGLIRPEITATLRRQAAWGELSLAFSRTELTAIGEEGAIDVHRLAASGRYEVTRRLTVTATPALTRNVRGERRAPVYMLDVASAFELNRRVLLTAAGRIGRQDGTLSGPHDSIPSQSVAVKLSMMLPRSAGGDARGRSPS